MRLCLAKKDWVRAEIVANKVNAKALNDEKMQVGSWLNLDWQLLTTFAW